MRKEGEMLAKDAIEFLKTVPPDMEICLQLGSELFPIKGMVLKKAYYSSTRKWLYSSVEFPSDWDQSQVVKIQRK